jgi:hypothetical protein
VTPSVTWWRAEILFAHDGCLPDDDTRGVVEQDPLADGGVRVDVDDEDVELERERQRAAPLRLDAVHLHSEEVLVIEEAMRSGPATVRR